MISIQNVTKNFGTHTAVNNLNWEITPGKVIGLLGPNGAGKTTTMRMIAGFYEPSAGNITINGHDVVQEPTYIKNILGYLPENNPLYEEMVTREYLSLIAKLKGISKSDIKDEVNRVAHEVGLGEYLSRPIGELSKGYKQRTGFAAAILGNPEIVILDEPQEGLDPNQRIEIRELIRKLGQNHTVIISTHVLAEVEATCDEVVIMKDGEIIRHGSPQEIQQEAAGRATIVLEAQGQDIIAALEGLPWVEQIQQHQSPHTRVEILVLAEDDRRPHLFNMAKEHNWTLLELHQTKQSLEDVFTEITQ